MDIQINNSNFTSENGYVYKSHDLTVEGKNIFVMQVTGKTAYINVTVKNAMQKAYKGLGKNFATWNEALENYKDAKIKAAIEYAMHN